MVECKFAEIAKQCEMIIGDRDALRLENEKLLTAVENKQKE